MKSTYIYLGLATMIIFGIAAGLPANSILKNSMVTPEGKGFAVVELFTSEGCSSCPPADKVLEHLAMNNPRLIVLSFHVDYWNKLGWKDHYSSAQYTQRQRLYAATAQGDGVYTPQVIVNGFAHFIGSEEQKIKKQIENQFSSGPSRPIVLSATLQDRTIIISYSSGKSDNEILNVALLQKHGQSQVTAGENRGSSLGHINIVRAFGSSIEKQGTLRFELPKELGKTDCVIVGYTQEKEGMQITGASSYVALN